MSDPASPAGAAEVLVIDDDAIMRDLIGDWLEAAGYQVRKATSCRAWLAQLLGIKPPALIVTDMFMPGPCGAEAIGTLKKKHPRTALVAVSGHFNSGQGLSAEEALAAGADRALAKPVKRAELLQAVAELVGTPSSASLPR
jgi:CheY-like chemotaxis protein